MGGTPAMIGYLRRAATGIRWYVGSVMGDHDYQRYRDHHARCGDPGPMMSEREYWTSRYAEQDRRPGSRCC